MWWLPPQAPEYPSPEMNGQRERSRQARSITCWGQGPACSASSPSQNRVASGHLPGALPRGLSHRTEPQGPPCYSDSTVTSNQRAVVWARHGDEGYWISTPTLPAPFLLDRTEPRAHIPPCRGSESQWRGGVTVPYSPSPRTLPPSSGAGQADPVHWWEEPSPVPAGS